MEKESGWARLCDLRVRRTDLKDSRAHLEGAKLWIWKTVIAGRISGAIPEAAGGDKGIGKRRSFRCDLYAGERYRGGDQRNLYV